MSHLSPEDRAGMHKRSACRKGRHLFGASQHVGAGISRQVCESCGEVTIDLTVAEEMTAPAMSDSGEIGIRSSDS